MTKKTKTKGKLDSRPETRQGTSVHKFDFSDSEGEEAEKWKLAFGKLVSDVQRRRLTREKAFEYEFPDLDSLGELTSIFSRRQRE